MRYLYLLLLLLCIMPALMQELDDDEDYEDGEDVEEEEGSLLDFDNFMKKYGKDYGYDGKLEQIRERELKRMHGAVYLDYTGAGIYQESQVRKCSDLLLDELLGNSHSRNPSSIKTEELVSDRRIIQSVDGSYAYARAVLLQHHCDRIQCYFHKRNYELAAHPRRDLPLDEEQQILLSLRSTSFCSCFLTLQCHNSVIGIREYAYRYGGGFRAVNEEDLPSSATMEVPAPDAPPSSFNPNQTFSLFAFPAEDNFAGVKYPLSWIDAVQKGFFGDVLLFAGFDRRVRSGWWRWTRRPSFRRTLWTCPRCTPTS